MRKSEIEMLTGKTQMDLVEGPEYFMPTRKMVYDIATRPTSFFLPSPFGPRAHVLECRGMDEDRDGHAYVRVTQEYNGSSRITNSFKEYRLARTVELTKHHNSCDLDRIEKWMKEHVMPEIEQREFEVGARRDEEIKAEIDAQAEAELQAEMEAEMEAEHRIERMGW